MEIVLLFLIIFVGLCILGFIFLIKLVVGFFSSSNDYPPPRSQVYQSSPVSSKTDDKAVLKAKLEDMYYKKIITLDQMKKALAEDTIPEPPKEQAPPSPEPHESQPIPEPLPTISKVPHPSFPNQKPANTESSNRSEAGQAPPPRPQTAGSSESTGFFSLTSVKTLLISGAALLFSSAFLFVRSHWEFIPTAIKFFSMAVATIGIYASGFLMTKRNTMEKTATTFLVLGLLLIPLNSFTANIWLFNESMSNDSIWALGSLLMFLGVMVTTFISRNYAMGFLGAASIISTAFFGARVFEWNFQHQAMYVSIGLLVLTGLYFLSQGV